MKIIEVLNARVSLKRIADNNMLSAKLSYKIFNFLKLTASDEEFYQKAYSDILNSCCQKDNQGNIILNEQKTEFALLEGKEQEAYTRLTELENTESQSKPDIAFTIDEFDKEGVKFNLKSLESIMPFVK